MAGIGQAAAWAHHQEGIDLESQKGHRSFAKNALL
jgi:hypothetical protein